MTKPKLIVVWGIKNVLTCYVESLLSIQEDWQVIRVSNKEDLLASIQSAEASQFEIYLIGQKQRKGSTNLPLKVIQDHPNVKVIMLDLDSNLLEVYSKQEILIKEASDLVNVIESQPSSISGLADRSS